MTENIDHPSEDNNMEVNTNGQQKKDYGSAQAYANEVRQWVQLTQAWMLNQQQAALMAMQPPVNFQPQPQTLLNIQPPTANIEELRREGAQRIVFRIGVNGNQPHLQTMITQEYTIPSFVRRIAAELIDFSILFFFKLIFVYLLVELEIVDVDQYSRILADEIELSSLIDITQGLFHIELGSKLVCGFVEAICISYGGFGYPIGCTPGKYMMRIQVISCLEINRIEGQADRVSITRQPVVPFTSSLIRATIKNSVFNVFFPLNTLFYFFPHNRAVYDVIAGTIVVSI